MAYTVTNDSATISTAEYSLPADTASGVPTSQTGTKRVSCSIDFDAMTSTEEYLVKVYLTTNGDQESAIEFPLVGAQPGPLVIPEFIAQTGWDITVDKISGTDRSIGWTIILEDLSALTTIASGVAALPSAATIATTVWAKVLEGAHTAGDLARLTASRLLGKATIRTGDGAYTYRDLGDTKDRIVGAVSGTARTISSTDGT